jgi:branched-chain amino acid transport system permease protein
MGYLSLGHAGFIALGAYTCVVLTVRWNFSPWLGIVAAGLVSGAMAWGLGAMTMRLRGIYFSLSIFAFGEIVVALVRGEEATLKHLRREGRSRVHLFQ